ncbi:hypothetical protein WICPIJ_006946 [Wickerhamomyces pijperi]|uniref:Tetrapyrrole biosynthesis uroporphyrinogen III synthase domain-containing protein n=1 Tax=Wickerhamomyces pijperi TaxID=599730 RepID=A0A9P8Q0T5_WICPI|nr:hypothetical protein WICPIJ_006946 [Wickerhamomyces pijperi]
MSQIFLLKNQTHPKDPYLENLQLLTPQNTPHFIPLLKHTHYQIQSLIDLLQSPSFLQEVRYLIITSQRAVESLAYALGQIDDTHRDITLKEKIWYTVGPATEKVLRELGVVQVRGGIDAGHGGVLSDLIIEDLKKTQDITGHDVVFFTGVVRRDIIPKKLTGYGISLKEVVIYQTVEREDILSTFRSCYESSKPTESSTSNKPWIVFFSPQGTLPIVKYLKEQPDLLKSLRVASIGPTTETYLQNEGVEVDLVSSKPDAEILVREMNQFTLKGL